jgi:hypothetical protein
MVGWLKAKRVNWLKGQKVKCVDVWMVKRPKRLHGYMVKKVKDACRSGATVLESSV